MILNDLKVALFLAGRAIRRTNKGTFLVTIIIMMLSIVNLLLAPSLLESISSTSDHQVADALLGHITIKPHTGNATIKNVHSLVDKLYSFPGVKGVSAHYSVGATISYKDKSKSVVVTYINPPDEETVTTIHEHVVEGDFLSKMDTGGIVLGNEVSGNYNPVFGSSSLGGVSTGETVNVSFSSGLKKSYRVRGIVTSKLTQADTSVFLNYKELKELNIDDEAMMVIVRLDDASKAKEYIQKFTSLGLNEEMYDSRELAGVEFAQTFDIIRSILTIIAFMVSMTTLFIIIYISAMNRRKLIAVMKALGINQRIIILSYTFQAIFYALCGIFFGLGILYFMIVPYFAAHPLDLPLGWVHLEVTSSVVVRYTSYFIFFSAITGIIPAYQIVKRNIVETMRS